MRYIIAIYNPVVTLLLLFALNHQFYDVYFYSRSVAEGVYDYYNTAVSIGYIVPILVGVIFFWLYGTLTMMVMKGRTISMRLIDVKVVKKDGSALKPLDVIMR